MPLKHQSVGVVARLLRALEATPPGVIEETAVASVRGWRFEPATYEGRPVTVSVTQTVRFELSG